MNFFQAIETYASHPEEVEINHVEMTEAGLFFYQDQQLILYIKDARKKVSVLEKNPELAHKFHLTNCTTIGNILHNHRVLRRFIATARSDGLFYVNGLTKEGKIKECLLKLKVCRSCLFKLNYKQYHESDQLTQNNIVETFDVREFFTHCNALLTDLNQTEVIPLQPTEITVNIVLVHIYFTQILLKQVSEYLRSYWFAISKH
jgi:hypothetical protein